MTALLSLAPVVAACYLLATLKGHAVLLLFLAASLCWCGWAVIRERRSAQLENLARRAEFDGRIAFDDDQTFGNAAFAENSLPPLPPPVVHPPARLPEFLAARSAQPSTMRHSTPVTPPVVQDRWREAPGADRVRVFPMHKLTRTT